MENIYIEQAAACDACSCGELTEENRRLRNQVKSLKEKLSMKRDALRNKGRLDWSSSLSCLVTEYSSLIVNK